MHIRSMTLARLVATTTLAGIAAPVWAQQAPNSTPAEQGVSPAQPRGAQDLPGGQSGQPVAGADQTGGEIIVTALKRTASVQNTPATVSVVSAETLTRSGIATIEQLGTIVPGVIIQRPPNNTANATIRGLGTAPGPVSFEQGVALFVDGVYAARGADFLSSLFDVERIEVVKGTQAAVLGKNTSLGAITLQTRRPGDRLAVDGTASHEFNRNSTTLSGGIDVPLGSTLAIRVAGQFQDLGGYLINRVQKAPAESDARQTNEGAGRITAVWKPASGLTVTANYSHEFLRNTGLPAEFIVGSPAAAALFAAAGYSSVYETNLDNHYATYNANGPTRLRQWSDRATGTIDYDLGFGTITSITGYSQFRQRRYIDYDYTPGDYYDDRAYIRGSQISQEVRLASSGDAAFQYLVGSLYVHNKLYQDLAESVHYPVNPQGAFQAYFDQTTDTYSAFAQPSLRLAEHLTVIGGVRYTSEKKAVDMQRLLVAPGSFTTVQYPPYALTHLSRTEGSLDGSGTVQYKPMPRLMLYASWGQGTKGGGFSDFAIPRNAPYAAEVARTIEAGFKLEGPSRAWHLNAAYFHTRVENFQNNLFNGSVFVVQNLHVASDGAELDALWQATRALSFTLDGTYARARNLDQTPGLDDRMPRSPRLAGKAAFFYDGTLSDRFGLIVGGDVTHRSRISHQLNPAAVPFGEDFTTLNGSIGVKDRDLGVELSLIGRNLNNATSISFASAVPNIPGAAFGVPEESRTVMIQLKFSR